jgi:hypothetical protein
MKANKKSGKRAAKADLMPRKSKDVKGGDTKATVTTKPTPRTIEINDFSFGVQNPTTTSS